MKITKKVIYVSIAGVIFVALLVTGVIVLIINGGDDDDGKNIDDEIDITNITKKIIGESDSLVLYISLTGKTQQLAQEISKYINADYEKIEPVVEYPADYKKIVEVVKEEQKNNSRPSYQTLTANITNYNNIFLGYPIWITDIPMLMLSVAENEKGKLDGKTIIPFVTSNSSGENGTVEKIKNILKNSTFKQWISVFNKDMDIYEKIIDNWLEEIGFKKA